MALQSSSAYSPFSGAFSMPLSKRSEIFPPSDTPSPQAYGFLDLNSSKARSPAWRISESKKVSVFDVKNKHPPPGAYKSPSYIKDGVSYSISCPVDYNPSPSKVSPVSYSPNLSLVKKREPQTQLTLRAAPDIKQTFEQTPGPGAYEQKIHELSSQSLKVKSLGKLTLFGQSGKNSIYNKDQTKFPGPTSYLVSDSSVHIPSPAFKFQQGMRSDIINISYEQNGPGMYDISKQILSRKSLNQSIQEKQQSFSQSNTQQSLGNNQSLTESRIDNFPGPGSYFQEPSSSNSLSNKSVKFGSAERLQDVGENKILPGPGQYNISKEPQSPTSLKNTFGDSKKKSTFEVGLSPGPGQQRQRQYSLYNLPPKIGEGPKYGIGGSSLTSFIPKSSVPGPGQYLINDNQTKPSPFSVKFNSKIDFTSSFQNPGPGSYDPKSLTSSTKVSFISNTVREAFEPKEGPSPSEYAILPQIAGLPEYHYKQINYFKDQIKQLKDKTNNSTISKGKAPSLNSKVSSQMSSQSNLGSKDE